MTNREWLAQNPEKITAAAIMKVIRSAAPKGCLVDAFSAMETLDEWLNAKHPEPEITHVTTIQVTKIFRGEPQPITEEEQLRLCAMIKQATRADDVKVAKIQRFERDAE